MLSKRWGSADFRQLKDLHKKLERLSSVELDAFCVQMANELAGRLLSRVKKRTPCGLWHLAGCVGGVPVGHRGDRYTVVVINNLRYASYVEYGHRQQPGRLIPGYWEGSGPDARFIYDPNAESGMVLKEAWTPGEHMLTISTQQLEQQAPAILERKLYKFLNVYNDKYGPLLCPFLAGVQRPTLKAYPFAIFGEGIRFES